MMIRSTRNGFRRLRTAGLVLLASLPGLGSAVAAASLSDYAWQNRPLLLFAPTHADSRLQQTLHNLQQRRCDLEDREMIIGIIVDQGQSRLDEQPITATEADSLRNRYDIEYNRFAVILIGKDGGEKYRRDEAPDPADIFALIDSMPMRRDELAQNPVDCGRQGP